MKTSNRILGASLAFAVLTAAMSPEKAAERWIKDHAQELITAEPDVVASDLSSVKDVVGDADIAGFGEATHGSREFFQMKDRIFRFLVEKQGFTGFGIEANFAAAEAIDRWVKGGEGDPEKLVAAMGFWTWDTEEVLTLIKWMRSYNTGRTEKISFRGIDMQHAAPNLQIVFSYLDQFAPDIADDKSVFSSYMADARDQREGYRHMGMLSAEQRRKLLVAAEELVRKVEERRDTLIAAGGKDDFLAALSGATSAAWYFLMEGTLSDRKFRNLKTGYDIRDRAMADLALLARQRLGEGGRLFIWAHNGHVANSRFEGDRMTMGQFLKQDIGSKYVSIGFAFDNGSFQAFPPSDPKRPEFKPSLSKFTIGPVPDDHSEAVLRRARKPNWIADLRALPKESLAYVWFSTPRQLRWTGANYSEELMSKHKPIRLTEHFDGLIFISKVTRARPLANTRSRQNIIKDW